MNSSLVMKQLKENVLPEDPLHSSANQDETVPANVPVDQSTTEDSNTAKAVESPGQQGNASAGSSSPTNKNIGVSPKSEVPRKGLNEESSQALRSTALVSWHDIHVCLCMQPEYFIISI